MQKVRKIVSSLISKQKVFYNQSTGGFTSRRESIKKYNGNSTISFYFITIPFLSCNWFSLSFLIGWYFITKCNRIEKSLFSSTHTNARCTIIWFYKIQVCTLHEIPIFYSFKMNWKNRLHDSYSNINWSSPRSVLCSKRFSDPSLETKALTRGRSIKFVKEFV